MSLSEMALANNTKSAKAEQALKELETKLPPKKTKDGKEVPCADSKEDVLKKLEAEKKAKALSGKGLSLQGAKDTGCSL
jgi:hypothetical protein